MGSLDIQYELAYLAYPWHSDPQYNTRIAANIAKDIMKKYKMVVITSHFAYDLLYGASNHSDPLRDIWERLPSGDKWICLHVGMCDLVTVAKCDVFIVGAPLEYSESCGICWEYCLAKMLGKKILFWDYTTKTLKEKYPWPE